MKQAIPIIKKQPPCGQCKGQCCDGSMFDDMIIPPNEVALLRSLGAKIYRDIPYSDMVMSIKGGCQFLIHGKCSIYEHRPKPCRQFNCLTSSHKPVLT